MFPTRRLGAAALTVGPPLLPEEQSHFLHRSSFNSYHFQSDLPRLPIPDPKKTIDRYVDSVTAQKSSLGEDQLKRTLELAQTERSKIQDLHDILIQYDKANAHTSYISEAWFDMYLRDRGNIPFNVTPFLGARRADDDSLNEMTLRAANLIISGLRLCNTLEKEWLEPELFQMGKHKDRRELYRKIVNGTPCLPHFTPPGNSVPLGLRTVLSYALLNAAPLDMSQYKNLFKSTRVPRRDKDELKVTPGSKHIMVQCRGRFYKLMVLHPTESNMILDFNSIHAGIRAIWHDAESRPYNQDSSIGYLSAWTRNEWADAREHLVKISKNNAKHMEDIDGAIFNVCLDDSVDRALAFNPKDARTATETMLWGNGATRWWDKSISWVVTKGGDAGITFEHSWGDGVAVMRCVNDTLAENFNDPQLIEAAPDGYTAAPWGEMEFDIDARIQECINTARTWYDETADDMDVSAEMLHTVGKNFFKKHKLSPDGVVQLAIQAGWQKVTRQTCPVYQSCSTSAFKHGRTENLRACTVESDAAVKLMLGGNYTPAELVAAIRTAGKKHGKLKMDAQMGQGFDRHIFGMKARALEHDLPIPELFSNDVFAYMSHFNLSTSTLDAPDLISGGFGAVVPDGLGVGYVAQPEYMGCNITARKSTAKCLPSEFTQSFGEVLQEIRDAFEAVEAKK